MKKDLKILLSEVEKKVSYYTQYITFNRIRINWFINYSDKVAERIQPTVDFAAVDKLICTYYIKNLSLFEEKAELFYEQEQIFLKNLKTKTTTLQQITQEVETKTSLSLEEEENIQNKLQEIKEDDCFKEIDVYLNEVNDFCRKKLMPESLKKEERTCAINNFIFFNFFFYLKYSKYNTAEKIKKLFDNTEKNNKKLEEAVSYIYNFLYIFFFNDVFQELEQITLLYLSSYENKNISERGKIILRQQDYKKHHKKSFIKKIETSDFFKKNKQNITIKNLEDFYEVLLLDFQLYLLESRENDLKKQKYLFWLQQELFFFFPSFFFLFEETKNKIIRELEKINLEETFVQDIMHQKFNIIANKYFFSCSPKQKNKPTKNVSASSSASKNNNYFLVLIVSIIIVVIILITCLVWLRVNSLSKKKKNG